MKKGKGKQIAIICAVPVECDIIMRALKGKRTAEGMTMGTINGRQVVIAVSGPGQANAARAATQLALMVNPRAMINIGIAGVYKGTGYDLSDVLAASSETYADTGALERGGLIGLKQMGMPLMRKGGTQYFGSFPVDARLLKAALPHVDGSGVFLTVSQVSGTMGRASKLRKQYDALCENMEGAPIAQTCLHYGIPMLEVRGISNVAGVRDKSAWRIEAAASNCQLAAIEIIKSL